MTTVVHLEEPLGDTLQITLQFLDADGAAESHSGSTWRGQVKTAKDSASSFATFSVNTASATSGIIVASIAATTTATATVGTKYYFDIEETTSGSVVTTWLSGDVTWRQDVSRA